MRVLFNGLTKKSWKHASGLTRRIRRIKRSASGHRFPTRNSRKLGRGGLAREVRGAPASRRCGSPPYLCSLLTKQQPTARGGKGARSLPFRVPASQLTLEAGFFGWGGDASPSVFELIAPRVDSPWRDDPGALGREALGKSTRDAKLMKAQRKNPASNVSSKGARVVPHPPTEPHLRAAARSSLRKRVYGG